MPVAGVKGWLRKAVAIFAALVRWLWHLPGRTLRALRTNPLRVLSRALALFVVVALLATGAYVVFFSWVDSKIATAEQVDQVVYLDQGWGKALDSKDRETYYYTPQGSFLKDVRYDWFVYLERPWNTTRFASPDFMRAYGFIVEPVRTRNNQAQLPIGFARRYEGGEEFLDLTCAACHTGQLHIVNGNRRVAIRIDGGPALHDVTSMRVGGFGSDLLASLTATYVDPLKFLRFAHNVLGAQYSSAGRNLLHANLRHVISGILKQAYTDQSRHLYPVNEGYGRADAIGRIANNVFAIALSPDNYRIGDAPVRFPPLWETWKFDWVQYTGSVRQPMARNIGQTLGTGARYYLLDPYGRHTPESERYNSSTNVLNLDKIERTLRKLQPPQWPESLFGAVDKNLAAEGRLYFVQYCQGCHGPHQTDLPTTRWDAPLKVCSNGQTLAHWKMTMLPVQDIGTDPKAALNFFRNRMSLLPSGMTSGEVRRKLSTMYSVEYDRQKHFFIEELESLASHNLPDTNHYADRLKQLTDQGEDDWVGEQLNSVDLSSVSTGQGLNYIVSMIRLKAYDSLGLTRDTPEQEIQQELLNGYGALDIPEVQARYKAPPLAGIWSVAPYLHNGSVPTLYDLLLPVYKRPAQFYIRSRYFDTKRLGLVSEPSDPAAFRYDTTIPGNTNTGHEFRAGWTPRQTGAPAAAGVIGPELSDHQRWAIIEYLKIHRNTTQDAAPDAPSSVVDKCPAEQENVQLHMQKGPV